MQKLTSIVGIVIAVAAVAGVAAYEVLTSSAPANPCAGQAPIGTSEVASVASGASHVTNPATRPSTPPLASSSADRRSEPAPAVAPTVIQVVAAENFWGSLVAQLGGNDTSVLSIVTDPNTDPHEYEANASDARAIAAAQYVIVNGVGYDQWALGLIAADGNSHQVILNVGALNGVSVSGGIVSGNPHMWYNPVYVNQTVAAMFANLTAIAPNDTGYFVGQYSTLNKSLAALYLQADEIRKYHAGAIVASTESIFVYLANYTGLDLVSPPAFMEAIAEGNDPPTQSVVTFECQLETGKVAVLVYNEQTVTPLTKQMKVVAASNNVTIVGVTETIQPPPATFQAWMGGQYAYLQNALNATELGS